MSQFYYDLVGEPPVATSLAFLAWCERLRRARRDTVPASSGAVHFYFSTSGNDANAGTELAPYQTMAKAQALVSAWPNDANGLCLHFKCGDRWNTDSETRLSFNGKRWIVVTDYGDRALGPPRFWRWGAAVAIADLGTSATRVDAFTNTLSYPDATAGREIYTVRHQHATGYAFRFVASVAAVDAAPGTCYRTGGVFYFRPFTESTLAAQFEFLTTDPTPGVSIFGATAAGWGPIFLCNLDVSGSGVKTYGTEVTGTESIPPIRFDGSGDDALYVLDCEVTYSSRHLVVTASPSGLTTAGTVLFIDGCRFGWCSSLTGMTLTVANTQLGGMDHEVFNTVLLGGEIPRPGVRGGIGIYSHAGAGTSLLDLVVNATAPPTSGNVDVIASCGDPPAMAALADCRSFQLGCNLFPRPFDEHDAAETGANVWSGLPVGAINANTVVANSEFHSTLIHSTFDGSGEAAATEAPVGFNVNGLYLNSRHVLDASRSRTGVGFGSPSCGAVAGSSQWQANFYHADFDIVARGGARTSWVIQQAQNDLFPDPGFATTRSVFRSFGGAVYPEAAATANPACYYSGNAVGCGYHRMSLYFNGGVLPGADYRAHDPSFVVLNAPGLAGDDPDQALADDTVVTVGGVSTVLEYDADGLPRAGRNARGRFRAPTVSNTTAPATATWLWSEQEDRNTPVAAALDALTNTAETAEESDVRLILTGVAAAATAATNLTVETLTAYLALGDGTATLRTLTAGAGLTVTGGQTVELAFAVTAALKLPRGSVPLVSLYAGATGARRLLAQGRVTVLGTAKNPP